MKEKILNILTGLRPEFDFAKEGVNFIEEGMLDSLDIVNLIDELEQEFSVEIDGLEVVSKNFSTLDDIMSLLINIGAK